MSDSQELPDQAADVSIIPSRSVRPLGAELRTGLTMPRQWSVVAPANASQMETESGSSGGAPADLPEPAGPAFVLETLVGRGGMGEVWAAEQTSLGRRVAVKRLLRWEEGEGTRAREAEFRQEAHAAASLEHPNILPVHDLGKDADGSPLLAMKLVEGRPWDHLLDEDRKTLAADEFLSRHIPILMSMTQAVAFAHSRGVVHRDLKPSQVMVGGFGEVLLTDWGLAICADDGEKRPTSTRRRPAIPTPQTASNPAGTPALMAPEQTERNAELIGTWTDVYLLGGTLYYLLTGWFPHEGKNAKQAFSNAKKGETVPPSERVPDRGIPKALEQLCLKALQPRKEDRLESATAFWEGLDEHVRGSARRAKSRQLTAEALASLQGPLNYTGYSEVLGKVEEARRFWPQNPKCDEIKTGALAASCSQALSHGDLALARLQAEAIPDPEKKSELLAKVGVADARAKQRRLAFRAAAAFAFILLLMVAFGSAYFNLRLQAINWELETTTNDAVQAKETAETNLAIARAQGAGASELINFILQDLREALSEELTPEVGVAEEEASRISFSVAGRVADPIMGYYAGLDTSSWPAELVREHGDRMVMTTYEFYLMGRLEEALDLTTQTLRMLQGALPPGSDDIQMALHNKGNILSKLWRFEEAIPILEQDRDRVLEKHGLDSYEAGESLKVLASTYLWAGELEKSLEVHKQALEASRLYHGEGSQEYFVALSDLGTIHAHLGRYDEARQHTEQALAGFIGLHGEHNRQVANMMAELADIIARQGGDLQLAKEYYNRSLGIVLELDGPFHPNAGRGYTSYAQLLVVLGEWEAALEAIQKGVEIYEKALGGSHGWTNTSRLTLATVHSSLGESEKSFAVRRQIDSQMGRTNATEQALHAMNLFAWSVDSFRMCDLDRALELIQESLELKKLSSATADGKLLRSILVKHLILATMGSEELSISAAEEAFRASEGLQEIRPEIRVEMARNLFRIFGWAARRAQGSGNKEQVEELSGKAVTIYQQYLTGEPPNPVDSLFLAECHHHLGQPAEARKYIDGVDHMPEDICGRDEALKAWEAVRAEYGR